MLHRLPRLFALLLIALVAAPAWGGPPPTINNLSQRGLQRGVVNTLVIDGANLSDKFTLLLGSTKLEAAVKSAAAGRLELEIKLDAAFPCGVHLLRVATAGGVSSGTALAIDDLPQRVVVLEPVEAPVAVTGAVGGNGIAKIPFRGKKGQAVTIDVEAKRLGSALNPVAHLYDSRHVQLTWAQPQGTLSGDCRLTTTLPADGDYSVEVHDLLYQGGSPSHFRVKLGTFESADFTFPLAIKQGTKASVELVSSTGVVGTKTEFDAGALLGPRAAPLNGATKLCGPAPGVLVSEWDEAAEAPPADGKLQALTAPAGVSGRIAQPGEEDRYQFAVQPGQKLRIEVDAASVGSPLDGVLSVRNEQGGQLAASDDRPGTSDPGLDFTVPAGMTQLVLAVKDLHGRGGASFLYRLSARPADRQDYSLSITDDRMQVPQQGAVLLRVEAKRNGYQGPIRLEITGLPPGVTASGGEISAGATVGMIGLSAAADATGVAIVTVAGHGTHENQTITRTAGLPLTGALVQQPWLAADLAVAATEPGPIALAWADAALPQIAQGGKYPLPVTLQRNGDMKAAVRVTLVTSQITPKKPLTEEEKKKQPPVQPKDDIERTLRLANVPTIPPDQTQATAELLAPADLPLIGYDLALRAEALSPDGKSVIATAVTPLRRATPVAAAPK